MAIRLRVVDGACVALCAARSVEKPGDVYLDDAQHYALAGKFAQDWNGNGLSNGPLPEHPEENVIREREEANNANRDEWDKQWSLPLGVALFGVG